VTEQEDVTEIETLRTKQRLDPQDRYALSFFAVLDEWNATGKKRLHASRGK
jgi:hypothetical protein